MSIDPKKLAQKIRSFYPEIEEHDLAMDVRFDKDQNSWLVSLKKEDDELTTHIDPEDAEHCMNGVECVYLGTQVGRFVEAYCLRGHACD